MKEPIRVDVEIPGLPSQVFGWSEVDGDWCFVLGTRETCCEPDSGETIVYGSSERKILECNAVEQARAFKNSESLIEEIYRHLRSRYEQSKGRGEEIVGRIRKIAQLLKQ